MSQDFELKFDEYKDNNPAQKEGPSDPDHYPSVGNVRNLAFVLEDGKMQFFNYSYLITCTLDNDAGSVLMEFNTHQVEIKGQRLVKLFEELMQQANKVIRYTDKRYEKLDDNSSPKIYEITVINKIG